MDPRRVNLFGINIDAVTREYMIARVDESITQGRPIWLTFINVAILVEIVRRDRSRQVLEGADYRLCDGRGLMHACRLLGKALPEMVSGPYLLFRLLKHGNDCGYSIFVLGSRGEIIKRAVGNIEREYPKVRLAGYHDGFFSVEEESRIVESIRKSGAQILFVGMGFPRERFFIAKWRKELRVPVIMDVGGAFTVLAGLHRLAPNWVSHVGLEWAYRLSQEPGRLWKRYLMTNFIFCLLMLREVFKKRQTEAKGAVN